MDKIEFIGYWTGRSTTRFIVTYTGISRTVKGFKLMQKVAKVCKIDTQDPSALTNNVFECLKYIH